MAVTPGSLWKYQGIPGGVDVLAKVLNVASVVPAVPGAPWATAVVFVMVADESRVWNVTLEDQWHRLFTLVSETPAAPTAETVPRNRGSAR